MGKKTVIFYTAAAVAFICSGIAASAQDLNPTVEVSRRYEGSLMEVHKPVMGMALPDSVDKFNFDFDYSVFENPFRSSYEFSPAMLNINLAPDAGGGRKLYFKAGAGYSLHPALDLVWTPVAKGGFSMSVYASHRSYFGRYRSLSPSVSGDGMLGITGDGGSFSGHDALSSAGISGSYDWKRGGLYFDAGYYGTALKDTLLSRNYDGVDIKFGVFSKDNTGDRFIYKADVAYRYAEDKVRLSGDAGKVWLGEHDFSFDAAFGNAFKECHSLFVEMGFDMASYPGHFGSFAGTASLTPKYAYVKNRWRIGAGVRFALLFRDNAPGTPVPMNTHGGQVVYPDVDISFEAIRRHMDIYLEVGGGPDINRYSSLLGSNRHIVPVYNPSGMPLVDSSEERLSATVGLRGNIASRFRYDLKAGYANLANSPLEMVYAENSGTGEALYRAGLGYSSYQKFFAGLDWAWVSQDVEADGYFAYTATDVKSRSDYLFAPAAFSGYARILYNWNGRIRAGVDCGFSSRRTGGIHASDPALQQSGRLVVPGYADLGAYLEFAMTRKFSLWCRGGNLLNSTIQRVPLYAESGIYFTAGICLNL